MSSAWCCLLAAFEGDPWHERVCPWAAARRPQVETLFDASDREGDPR